MAAAGGGSAPGLSPVKPKARSVWDHLQAEPFEFDFFQAVRLWELHALRHGRPVSTMGLERGTTEEVIRFRPPLSLAFPPSQIVSVDPPDEFRPVPVATIAFFGLYGPSTVLPTHYTQLLMDIQRDVRGPERRSLRDWLDLFNHRLTTLFQRAWEKYRFGLAYERGEADRSTPDTFTLALKSLMGLGSGRLQSRIQAAPWMALKDISMMYFAGLLAQRPRNAVNLRALIAGIFFVSAAVDQFRGQWLPLPIEAQTQLGGKGTLGAGAVAGSMVWDVQSKFRIALGPLTYAEFSDLLPDPTPLPQRKRFYLVGQLVRLFAGSEYDFEIQLKLKAQEIPEAQVGETEGLGTRLGWNCWLISETPAHAAEDAVFDGDLTV